VVDRSVVATRQLATARVDGSRGRHRLQTRTYGRSAVVDAFLAAAQAGDFEGLVAILHSDIVLRADAGAGKGMSRLVRGAQAVAGQAAAFSKMALSNQVVLVNGNGRIQTGSVGSIYPPSSTEPLASSHFSRSLRHGCEGHHGRRTSRWSRFCAAGCYLTPRAAWLSATVGQQERDAV
jgi:hypothetical protein